MLATEVTYCQPYYLYRDYGRQVTVPVLSSYGTPRFRLRPGGCAERSLHGSFGGSRSVHSGLSIELDACRLFYTRRETRFTRPNN